MKPQQLPQRTCIVSRERLVKGSMIRVCEYLGVVKVDLSGKALGRGVYLKKSLEVILQAKKTKALERALKVSVPMQIYDELIALVNKQFPQEVPNGL
ncbi:MAG: YlxR family protein [Acholeplasmatales bacterium]|jgi:predicted RNA-binding protein YlxR (DUF448 family)|nr:YlxR family protein [Acholeplasmatales bacterium]